MKNARLSLKFVGLLLVLLSVSLPAVAANTQNAPGGGDEDTSDQAALPAKPGEAPYTIIAGDVLQVTVWKEDGLDRETLVLPDGTINFPLIGALTAQGKTPLALQ